MIQPQAISKRAVRFAIALLTTASLISLWAVIPTPSVAQSHRLERQLIAQLTAQQSDQPTSQQIPGVTEPWQRVYQLVPELPLENQYVNARTGEPSPNNTLASRLIRYHLYVKSRPPNYRLDWKLTMADYLGANDWIRAELYPGWDTLTVNPMEGDVAAIQNLNRAQRDALVNAMVTIFNSETDAASSPTPPANSEGTNSTPPSPSSSPVILQPRPGDAQLLLP